MSTVPTPVDQAAIASAVRHKLLLRDMLTFVALLAVTVVLFMATLFLFRSFTSHQHDLAVRWSDRGKADLAAGTPEQAVLALRTALTYAPGERQYELLLAEALGDAGHVDESFNYFTGLWDAEPGNGLINLRLARLAAAKSEGEQAVNFYRASVFGTWPGDAIERRMQVRLELARYLIKINRTGAARDELLIAAANAGRNGPLELEISGMLEEAGDAREALEYARRASVDQPANAKAAATAARLSFGLGEFTQARTEADRAMRLLGASQVAGEELARVRELRTEADRITELDTAGKLTGAQRVQRIEIDVAIARTRLMQCLTNAGGTVPEPLAALSGRWAAATPELGTRVLGRSEDAQDAAVALIDDTERETLGSCGTPVGDDALLLRLAEQHASAGGSVDGRGF